MVLRQEDGAVRPEKRKVLETQQRVVVGAIKASPAVKKKLAVEKKTELSAQRKIQPCCAETKRNAKDTRNERIARPEEKVALDTLEKEDRAVRPEKNTALLCRNETRREGNAKRTKRRPASFDISEETPYSGLPTADTRDHLLPDGSDPTRRTAQSKLISSTRWSHSSWKVL